MMGEHPIQSLMKTALISLQEMTKVNTIIGDPIETPDGHMILTVSRLGFGFAAGGSEFQARHHEADTGGDEEDTDPAEEQQQGGGNLPFGGGSGGGVSITPIAFLIVGPNGIQTLHLDNKTHFYEKLIDLAPQTLEKIEQWMSKTGYQAQGEDSKKENEIRRGFIRHSVKHTQKHKE